MNKNSKYNKQQTQHNQRNRHKQHNQPKQHTLSDSTSWESDSDSSYTTAYTISSSEKCNKLEKQSDKHSDKHSEKHSDKHSEKQSEKQSEKCNNSEKHSDKHSDKHSEKHSEKYSEKHSEKHSEKCNNSDKQSDNYYNNDLDNNFFIKEELECDMVKNHYDNNNMNNNTNNNMNNNTNDNMNGNMNDNTNDNTNDNLIGSFGSFYSSEPQTIPPNYPIIFETHGDILNLNFINNSSNIEIVVAGIYICHITCQFGQPCQVAFFINDLPEMSTITSSNSIANFISIHQILNLKAGDKVSFKNYISHTTITTNTQSSGLINPCPNINLNIWKIAPPL